MLHVLCGVSGAQGAVGLQHREIEAKGKRDSSDTN